MTGFPHDVTESAADRADISRLLRMLGARVLVVGLVLGIVGETLPALVALLAGAWLLAASDSTLTVRL